MATMSTSKAVERLRAKSEPYWDLGATGLGVRITKTGKRILVCQLKYPGNKAQSVRTLGLYPGLSLEAAREKARAWYQMVKQGIDPAAVEEEERRKAEAARQAAARTPHDFAPVATALKLNLRPWMRRGPLPSERFDALPRDQRRRPGQSMCRCRGQRTSGSSTVAPPLWKPARSAKSRW